MCRGWFVVRFLGERDFDLVEGELRSEDDRMECTTGDFGSEFRLADLVSVNSDDI